MAAQKNFKFARRVVVKVGTSTITYKNRKPNLLRIEKLVREIAGLANEGYEMVLVTSGAIAVGMDRMGLTEKPRAIPEKQAVAAVGQAVLMNIYERLFGEYGQTAGQVLLSRENSTRHNQYTNSRNALMTMLGMGIVPVVNENDAVTVDEIKIGDNDTLSATVALLIDADALILLSDVDGLYTSNPMTSSDAKLIRVVKEITPEIESLAGEPETQVGTGGMYTKLKAAKVAMNSGVMMAIVSGEMDGAIRAVLSGEEVGTMFPAKESHLAARKSWLAFGKSIAGDIVVDDGCERAMMDGASLLAAGIECVEGEFEKNSTVRVMNKKGREIARGIVNFDNKTLSKIKKLRSGEIQKMLGVDVPDEVIHRDNMVIME